MKIEGDAKKFFDCVKLLGTIFFPVFLFFFFFVSTEENQSKEGHNRNADWRYG